MSWISCILSNVALALILAASAWCVQRWLRQHAAARLLWVLVLVKLVTPPLFGVSLRASPGTMACAIGACGCAQHVQSAAIFGDRFSLTLLTVWAVGAAAASWTAWRRWSRFRQLLAHVRPAPYEWQALAERMAVVAGVRRMPRILTTPGYLPPLVVAGLRGSRMLLPADFMDGLNGSQQEALLLHELIHLKRCDHWVRLLESLVRVVYWWLPLFGVIGRRMRDCEEACCDAAVLKHLPHARRDYACLLLDVMDFVAGSPQPHVPQATAMSTTANDLERRLRAIVETSPPSRGTSTTVACAMVLGCAIIPIGLRYEVVAPSPLTESSSATQPVADAPRLLNCEGALTNTLCCPS